MNFLKDIFRLKNVETKRVSSYDVEGRNSDFWKIEPKEKKVLAEIEGPGCITHIWMTQRGGPFLYREVLLKFYWDDEESPSVLVPLGDFFCLGHSLVNSFCSLPFTVSTSNPYKFGGSCALNCYLPMPFRKKARIEIENQGENSYNQYFYIDYETYKQDFRDEIGYLHALWRRENPTPGWGDEFKVNTPEVNIVNKGKEAYENNYLVLETEGKGHFIGFNLSVTNFHSDWWGEGDEMVWIDGYKWPPDLHGTGSEDCFNQAYGMQEKAYLFNGSSIYEKHSVFGHNLYDGKFQGGYQTSYIFYITNPIHFKKSIKFTIEHGHGNHLSNDWSSTAYWYQIEPHKKFSIPSVEKRLPVLFKFDKKFLRKEK